MGGNSLCVSVATLLVVMAVIMGAVGLVSLTGGGDKSEVSKYPSYFFKHGGDHHHRQHRYGISKDNKAANAICKPTEFKDACDLALSKVAKNSSATNKDYVLATFRSTVTELDKAIRKASSSMKGNLDEKKIDDLHNCEKMLGYAVDELKQVLKVVANAKPTTISDNADPILVWLTAVRAYQTTCVDEIKDKRLKRQMKEALETANKMTFNAQKIVYNIHDIMKEVNMNEVAVDSNPLTSLIGHHKVLLEMHNIERDGFPSWVSAAERKLFKDDHDDEQKDKDDDHKDKGKDKDDDHEAKDKDKDDDHEAKDKDKDDDEGHEDDNHGSKDDEHWAKGGDNGAKGEAIFATPTPPPLPLTVVPNAVVAPDGTGKFKRITDALAAYPPYHKGRYIVYVKAGVYNEGQIVVGRNHNNVFMYGDGIGKTIITGDLSYAVQRTGTSRTATFIALGERFMAKGITFRNTVGPAGHQAVAFRSQSPHTVMMDCSFEGYQDTLYYHAHDQFYKNCQIWGTVDFIFGSGRAFIQDSDIYVRKPDVDQANIVTSDGKVKHEEAGGVVMQNCRIMATPELEKVKRKTASYLGRPWKASATSVIMQCDIGDMIRREGWMKWESKEGAENHMTCTFREFANRGPGSATGGRMPWPSVKAITDHNEEINYTAGSFIDGGAWLPVYGVPANLGL